MSLIFIFLSSGLSANAFLILIGIFYATLSLLFPSDSDKKNYPLKLEVGTISLLSILPLLAVFVFFLGQTGFYSYHVIIFSDEELSVVAALALARIAAGVLLMVLGVYFASRMNMLIFVLIGSFEVAIVYLLLSISNYILVFFAIIAYEIFLNLIAVSAQTSAGMLSPDLAKLFLPMSIIVGAVVGPVLFGVLHVELTAMVAVPLVLLSVSVSVILFVSRNRLQKRA